MAGRCELGEAIPSVDIASKIVDSLGASLDYLVGKADLNSDNALLDKLLTIQQLMEEDREHTMYSIDGEYTTLKLVLLKK